MAMVFDEAHRLAGSHALALVDQLIRARPPQQHVVLLSRQKLELPDLPRWRLEGEVVSLSQPELAEWQVRVEGGRRVSCGCPRCLPWGWARATRRAATRVPAAGLR